MKILVTGANGYLGQGVVKCLIDKGVEVVATDLCADCIDLRARIKITDIFGLEKPYEYFGKPDVVLHLAWRDGFQHDSMRHLEDLPKHSRFLKALSEAGIRKICVLGSMHEIGFYEGSVNENTPTNPQSLYGISKNALRQVCEIETRKNHNIYQWIRGFYIVGNVEHGCSVFSKIAAAVRQNEKIFPFTSGQNQFDFIDYNDFCKQVVAVVMQDSVTGIINCCSGRPVKLAERVERFIEENRFDIQLSYGTFPDRLYDSKAIWGDCSKINQIMENSVGKRE